MTQQFRDLNLPLSLQKALDKIGFKTPTDVQAKAIPQLLEGKDLLVCSETGSGKTAAYLVPMIKVLTENPESTGLVLAPTRELVSQIADFLVKLTGSQRHFNVAQLVGGQDIRQQFRTLRRNPRIIVATPGRLIDHLKRKTVRLDKTASLVLDEGDRMIDIGFAPQLDEILRYLPSERQTSFFTATLGPKVKKLSEQYLTEPDSLFMSQARPVERIKQSVLSVAFRDKDESILKELENRQGHIIVFLKTKRKTDDLTRYLSQGGVSVGRIHGGRSQQQRNQAIDLFKRGKIRVLCATDVAARGIDVPQVEHVINFDLPMQDEDYVHRVGRTARNGAEGEALSFVTPDEHRSWNRLVKKYNIVDALLPESSGGRRPSKFRRTPNRRRKPARSARPGGRPGRRERFS